VKGIDSRVNGLSSTEKTGQRHRMISKAMTMSEGALIKYFDLVPGKWRINASLPGYKVVGCAVEDLRRRPFPLRQVEASEFAKQVPFDEKGEPIERPVMLHGMPIWYYYYGNTVYIYPPPLHAWRLMLTHEPREETSIRNVLGEFTGRADQYHGGPIARARTQGSKPCACVARRGCRDVRSAIEPTRSRRCQPATMRSVHLSAISVHHACMNFILGEQSAHRVCESFL